MEIYRLYLKNKDIWDSIFILLNIVFCFVLIGILYVFIPKQTIVTPKLNVDDNATTPDLNCQFSNINFNPFFYYTVLIQIYPTYNNSTKEIVIALNGYTATRYTDNFQFDDVPSFFVSVYNPKNGQVPGQYFEGNGSSQINEPIFQNLYEVNEEYNFYPCFCIDDYFTNWFVYYIQQSFQTDIFNPQLRPFLPVLISNFTQSLDLEICNSTNSFVFDGGMWDVFRTQFEQNYIALMKEIQIQYTCFDIELEDNFDYFMRVSAYSFLITLILLFIQFTINIFISFNFSREIKEIRRGKKRKN